MNIKQKASYKLLRFVWIRSVRLSQWASRQLVQLHRRDQAQQFGETVYRGWK